MSPDSDLKKLQADLDEISSLLKAFKNSEGSDLVKDLKFYKTAYGSSVTPAMNNVVLSLHEMQGRLNESFLPKRYNAGDLKLFNMHQLEMLDNFLDPQKPPTNVQEVTFKEDSRPRNKFMELMENTTRAKNVLRPTSSHIFVRSKAEGHPFAAEIAALENLGYAKMYEKDAFAHSDRPFDAVTWTWVDDVRSLEGMYEKLVAQRYISVDLEHHNFHSYRGVVCLIQVSTLEEDFLIDAIKLREVLQSKAHSLNKILSDPSILKIFHGAESDIAWLQRDFDAFVVNMFDSYHAAKSLVLPRLSLAYLLEKYCGIELDKKYQLADWRERPLPAEMVEYARKDTHYLIKLFLLLKDQLGESQLQDVFLRSNRQCLVMYEPEEVHEKSWRGILDRSSNSFDESQFELIRKMFYWREERAQALDVSPVALMPNSSIVKVVQAEAKAEADIRGCLRHMSELLKRELESLSALLQGQVTVKMQFTSEDNASELALSQKRTHIRFEDPEIGANSIKPVVLAESEVKLVKTSRISFVNKNDASSAAAVFTSSKSNGSVATSQALSKVIKRSLPQIAVDSFLTKEKQATLAVSERDEIANQAVDDGLGIVEVAKIHGSNRLAENLDLSYSSSTSTKVTDQLRKGLSSKSSFSEVKSDKLEEQVDPEDLTPVLPEPTVIFDPYKVLTAEKKKAPFLVMKAPLLGPRINSAPMSGNRTLSFTQKRITRK